MKRCPECRREYDNTMGFCLDDGTELLYGPASMEEPATAIFPHGREAEPQSKLGNSSERQSLSAHRAAEPQEHLAGEPEARRAAEPEEHRVAEPQSSRNTILSIFCVAVLVLVAGFFGYRYFNAVDTEQIDSIAVLPFENRSGSGDTEYLSDGLADSLIFRLSQLPNLKVSPTSSVMRYKGTGTDTSQIARELDVAAVMSGRLVQVGDSLNISVQLINARTGKLIWAEQYDRKLSDL